MEEQRNTNEYRTGETRPKEKRTGPIAALFICVIFLGGLLSALSILNVHFSKRETTAVSFSKAVAPEFSTEETAATPPMPLGFTCQAMAITYQYLNSLPTGLYINHVEPDSQAAAMGIAPGDVLIAVDDTLVNHPNTLAELISLCPDNKALTLQIYHTSLQATVSITISCTK